jgi:hypothetical protein
MNAMDYLDFDVEIERADGAYRVESDSPVGQACSHFSLPFADDELVQMLGELAQANSSRNELGRTFGARLFEAVFDGEMRACLRGGVDEAARQGKGLRMRLRLNDTPELADLPWEYLYHPALDRYLALSALTPVVRYLELPERIRSLAVAAPLRILVAVASPSDQSPIDADGEWNRLRAAMRELEERGLVVLKRIPGTLAALQDQLRGGAYHMLYFIGHGDFDERRQTGLLLFEDEEGFSDRVSGADLGLLLHDHCTLRLVVLHACEGARTSRTDPFAGAAQCLVRQGLPAVIAMQFPISGEAAALLARAFFGAIADGYAVDAALAEARKALFTRGNRDEWGTPVLFMRTPDGKLFDLAPSARQNLGAAIQPAPGKAAPAAPASVEDQMPSLLQTYAWRSASRIRRSKPHGCRQAA